MQPYNPRRSLHCPKCGAPGVPSVRYSPGAHRESPGKTLCINPLCQVIGEHLQGWCGHCHYAGPEYVFTVKEATKRS